MTRSLKTSILRTLCIAILLTVGSRTLSMQDTSTSDSLQQQKKVCEIITQKGIFWDAIWNRVYLDGWSEKDKKWELKKLSKAGSLNANAAYAGIPAIHYAIAHGYPKLVKFLVKKGANINSECVGTLLSPIHSAILAGNIEIAKFLIENGADLDKQSCEGTSTLQMAAQSGYVELVKILIDKKIDMHKKDILGSTALHSAAFFGNKKILELLILNGIDHAIKNSKNVTALDLARFGCENWEHVKNIRSHLESKGGNKFYENTENNIKKNLSANFAYLTLVKDFYGFLKVMREGAQTLGAIFEKEFIAKTFKFFAKTYFTGENAGQNFTDVQNLLPLDKDNYFTKSFNTWAMNHQAFGVAALSTIPYQPQTVTSTTNTPNLCAIMGNLSLNKK